MEVAVYNTSGKETKKVQLKKEVFGIEPSEHAIYLDVKQFLANQRQGTHKSKERAEIVGSTRKIKRQKGTGTARAGSLKNPLFRGGGRVFGPEPRDYGFKLNKKQKQLARRSALSTKVKEAGLMVVEDFTLEAPKTQEFSAILNNLKVADKRSLLIVGEGNKNVMLSSRNLQNSRVVTVSELNTYEIMKAKSVMISESALNQIETLLS